MNVEYSNTTSLSVSFSHIQPEIYNKNVSLVLKIFHNLLQTLL